MWPKASRNPMGRKRAVRSPTTEQDGGSLSEIPHKFRLSSSVGQSRLKEMNLYMLNYKNEFSNIGVQK